MLELFLKLAVRELAFVCLAVEYMISHRAVKLFWKGPSEEKHGNDAIGVTW